MDAKLETMATKTPSRDDTHGEAQQQPRFGGKYEPGEESYGGVYDDQRTPLGDPSNPTGDYAARQQSPAGDPSDPRSSENSNKSAASDIQDQESDGAGPGSAGGNAEQQEQSLLSGSASGEEPGSGFFKNIGSEATGLSKITGIFKDMSPRKFAGIAVIGLLAGGGFTSVALLSGPFQFVHFAQTLQKHFKANEDFGNDRTSKILLYSLSGQGGQNGRLGITGNKAANKWEKRLIAETGMRPVFQEGTRRFVGFEIVDDNKAQQTLGDIGEKGDKRSARLQQSMGKGAKISSVGNAGLYSSGDNKTKLDSNKRFVDLRDVDFADRRVWIRSVTSATNVNGVSSAIGARLLKERGGVRLHPLNKVKGKVDAELAKRFEDKRVKEISEGAQSTDGELKPATTENAAGEEQAVDPKDSEVSAETKSYIDDFKSSGAFKSAKGAAIATGVMCIVKSFGNSVEDYKYTNNVLPMMRLGMNGIATGNQIMSFDDFDLDVMRMASEYMYDEKKNTSWSQAESIRTGQGKTGGIPTPPEADLGKAGEKPKFFRIVDDIPVLGTVCDVQNAVGNLPIIKQVGDAGNKVIEEGAAAAGVNTDELLESALKLVAGKSVDPKSQGANYGSLSDTGAFYAANESSWAGGGRDLSDGERANLVAFEEYHEKLERDSKPVLARYFDPFDQKSITGSMVNVMPVNATQAGHMLSNPVQILGSGFSRVSTTFTPKTHAQETTKKLYDYGAPKKGFSLAEQRDPLYENPFENGQRDRSDDGQKKLPPLEDDLPRLNDLYGKKCFGTTVTTDEDGVHVKTERKNAFKVIKEHADDCDPQKNRDDRLNQYRVYIADAITAVSLACYEGDEAACTELGMGNNRSGETSEAGDQSGDGLVSGESKDLANKILQSGKVSINPKYQSQIKDIADGKATCNVNPTILQLIATIAQNHTINISSLNRKCTNTLTASGTGSYHYRDGGGHAVDIAIVDGQVSTGGTGKDIALLKEILPLLPEGSGIGQVNCRGGTLKLPKGVTQFEDACNHIHIQVPPKGLE